MDRFVFSSLITIMKKYAIKTKESNQIFISYLFSLISNYDEKYILLASNNASRIMQRKYDVPKDIREMINSKSLKEVATILETFIDKKIDKNQLDLFFDELKQVLNSHPDIPNSIKIDLNNNRMLGLLKLLIHTIKKDNRLIIKKEIWRNGCNTLNVINGDIIALAFNAKEKQKEKIVVIPFDVDYHLIVTKVNNKYQEVSSETIHGKWIQRMVDDGYSIDQLKKEIKDDVINPNEIGSIAKISKDNVLFYLLGLSKFDSNNRAQSNINNVRYCISKILDEYDKTGQGVPLYIPLLGTGRSRVYLSKDESEKIIKEECLKNKEKIMGTVNIVLYTNDLKLNQ